MNVNPNDLARAAEHEFQGCSRKELEAFAGMLQVDYHPNIGDEKLRARINEKLGKHGGEFPPEETAEEAAEREQVQTPTPGMEDFRDLWRLNLTPDGRWEGRRRMVSIVRPEGYKGNQPQPFRWGRHMVMVPYNKAVSVPYPIYELMRNSNYIEIEQERTQGRDGTPKMRNHKREVNRWNMTDMGDDPKTANLPTSQKEQFRQIAEQTNRFAGWNRRQITLLARRLKIRYPRGEEPEMVRDRILAKLGYDVDMMEEFAA